MVDYKDSFIMHSFKLVLSRLSLGISGFLFWLLAARCYSMDDIGTGAVLISISSLFVFLASLGAIPTFVRFLPESEDPQNFTGTLTLFSFLIIVLLFLIFFAVKDFISSDLDNLKQPLYLFSFFLFTAVMLLFQILEGLYLALKDTGLTLLVNLIQNFLRILLIFLLIFLGGFGIFFSNVLSALVAVVVSLVFFLKKYPDFRPQFRIDTAVLKKILPFSLANFLYSFSLTLPGMIFPVVILITYSARDAGLFYIPWMIFSVFCTFITSVNGVFLMKTSHGENRKKMLINAVVYSAALAVAGFVLFVFQGDKFLLLFKKEFAGTSFVMLKILFYSIFFFVINQVYLTTLNIDKNAAKVKATSIIIIITILVLTVPLMVFTGPEGAAWAWLISQITGSVYLLKGIIYRNQKAAHPA